MTEISEETHQAVKRGVSWLDEKYPGWETKIDLDKLAMADCNYCVIGQAVGDFHVAIQEGALDGNYDWAIEHGFDVIEDVGDGRSYRELENCWYEVVKDRLGRI